MTDLRTATLPVLPLSSGAVLPGMVVTIAVETDEAKAAFDAVGEQDQLLLVPRVDGRYGRIGVIAQIEDRGAAPERHLGPRGPGRASAPPWVPAWWAPAPRSGSRPSRSTSRPIDDEAGSERIAELAP